MHSFTEARLQQNRIANVFHIQLNKNVYRVSVLKTHTFYKLDMNIIIILLFFALFRVSVEEILCTENWLNTGNIPRVNHIINRQCVAGPGLYIKAVSKTVYLHALVTKLKRRFFFYLLIIIFLLEPIQSSIFVSNFSRHSNTANFYCSLSC